MNKKILETRLKAVNEKIEKAFSVMLESASDADIKKYEMLLEQAHKLEEELSLAEMGELKDQGVPQRKIEEKENLSEREKFGRRLVEAVNSGTAFSGVIPRDVAEEIQRKKSNLAKIRGLCSVHVATGDYTVFVEGNGATVSYVGENTAIGETDPDVAPISLSALKLGAIVRVSREFMSDLGVDIMSYLVDVLSKAFAKKEDAEILFGTGGSTALNGIATSATNVVTAAEDDSFTWEEVKEFIQAIGAYRTGATIVCSQAFLDMCHNFKSGDTYLFPQGQQITQIMGIPVVVSDELSFAAGTATAVCGDFSYYHFMDRQNLEISLLTERYAEYDQVGIRAIERIDGDFVDEAFSVFKMATASD